MRSLKSSVCMLAVALIATLSLGGVASADDSEIFTGTPPAGATPNILFILDTSGSMATLEPDLPYDPMIDYNAAPYNGGCSKTVYYYAKSPNNNALTGCTGLASVPVSSFLCQQGIAALTSTAPNTGQTYQDFFVQWRKAAAAANSYSWTNQLGKPGALEVACKGDYPDPLADPPDPGAAPYPVAGAVHIVTDKWTAVASPATAYWPSGTNSAYVFYSGNYLSYRRYIALNPATTQDSRINIVKNAASNIISSVSGVNIGLMRYSNGATIANDGARGGMVAFPVSPIASNRAALTTTLNSYTAAGWTPLSETLYEANQYFAGGNVVFGNTSVPFKSVAGSRVGGAANGAQYASPIKYSCQKNYIVYLTDGLPTQDNEADSFIQAPPINGVCDNPASSPYNGFATDGTPLPGSPPWGPSTGAAGACMSALSGYMATKDVYPGAAMPGDQHVQLYAIGFGSDPALAAAFSWLKTAARKGNGDAYSAADAASLQQVLTNIVGNILTDSTTFTAPTVAVNAFNRTQTLDDLYVSLFQPSSNLHWPGNVKKYQYRNNLIEDVNNVAAVNPSTGFFQDSARDFWSPEVDGSNVKKGGAASQIPNWDETATPTRNVYTYIGSNTPASAVDLTTASSRFVTTNALITNAILGVTTVADRTETINYSRGEDLKDESNNLATTDTRHAMGDPLHAQPAVVIYGGTPGSPDVNDSVVFSTTNDGFLHAFKSADGKELWSYIPQELLGDLFDLYQNNPTTTKHYSLDGSIRVIKYDANGDGIVDPSAGDKVILVFGQGRGGSNYYAIDVTNRDVPKFMWSIGPSTLTGIGQAWSTPAITRINIAGATQNTQKLVLVIAGGYDPIEESAAYRTADNVGNAIYFVDALYGTLLWKGSSSAADFQNSRMDHAIPSDVTLLDLDGDGYLNRMYVGDLAGQLWRFDVLNGQNKSNLVVGGVIASLGAHDDPAVTAPAIKSPAKTRRFYNAPDIAAVQKPGVPSYFNIAIGSGYRGHPLDTTAQDRMYAVRDKKPFVAMTQAEYDSFVIIRDDDQYATAANRLDDITSIVAPTLATTSLGWKLMLNDPSWRGEKVLSSASSFNNQVLFTTYTPSLLASADPCIKQGLNRVYAISIFDGRPVDNLSNHNNAQLDDRYSTLEHGGIAPQVSFLFPPGVYVDPNNPGGPPDPNQRPVVCLSGVEVLGACRSLNSRIKTYWNGTDAQ